MFERLYEGYLGINKMLMKVWDVLFWFGMVVEIIEKVKKCLLCLEN